MAGKKHFCGFMLFILLLFSLSAFGDEIIKKDGSKLVGYIVRETEQNVFIDISGLEIKIDKGEIKEIIKKSEASDPAEIQADFEVENKKYEAAIEQYENLLKEVKDEDSKKRISEKIEAAKLKIEERDLQKFSSKLKEIDLKIQSNKFDSAEKELEEILNSIPESNPSRKKIIEKKANLHFSKANYYFNLVRNVEAEKELKTAIEIDPNFAPAHIKYASLMDKRADYQGALNAYLKGLECGDELLTPKEKSEYHYRVGVLFFQMGEYDQAITHFDYLIKQKKEYYTQSQEMCVESYMQLAALCVPKNNDKAIEFLKKALEVNTKSKNAIFFLGRIYFDMAKYDEALERFSELKSIDTKYQDVHYYIGMCQRYLGDANKAKDSFEQEIANNPDHYDSYCEIGEYYFDGGDYEKAEKFFKDIKEKRPEKFRAYLGLGKVYRVQRKNDLAKENLQKVLDISKNHVEANLNLGAIYKDQEKYSEAKQFFDQVIENLKATEKDRKLNPKETKLYSEALIKKGEIDLIIGQPRSAMDFFRNALIFQPNNSDAFYNLGEAFKKLKDFKSAEAHYKKAISINPNEAKYYQSLGIMYQNDLKNLPAAIENYKQYILRGGPDHILVNQWIQECGEQPIEPPTEKSGEKSGEKSLEKQPEGKTEVKPEAKEVKSEAKTEKQPDAKTEATK